MVRPSRRELLAGAGSALLAGSAGCLGFEVGGNSELEQESEDTENGESKPPWEPPTELPDGLVSALTFVLPPELEEEFLSDAPQLPPTDDGDETEEPETRMMFTVIDHRDERPEVGLLIPEAGFIEEDERIHDETDIEWEVRINPGVAHPDTSFTNIWVGDIVADPNEATAEHHGFRLYDADDDQQFATDGEVAILGDDGLVTEMIERVADGGKPYIVLYPRVAETLRELPVGVSTMVLDGPELIAGNFGWTDGEFDVPETLCVAISETEETELVSRRTHEIFAYYSDEPDESATETLRRLGEDIAAQPTETEETEITDNLLKLSVSYPFIPQEKYPEIPNPPVLVGYDEEQEEVLFGFTEGDDIETENLSVEIDGEPYTGEWARGQETIGGGDVIGVDADAIEPRDQLTLLYEEPEFGIEDEYSYRVLGDLPFEYIYDPETDEMTITYGNGPPLPGERLTDETPEDTGSIVDEIDGALRPGESVTLSEITGGVGDGVDFDTGSVLGVNLRYERTDEHTTTLGFFPATPPGSFAFERENDTDTLTITYSTAEPVQGGTTIPGDGWYVDEMSDSDTESDWSDSRPPGVYKTGVPLDADQYELRVDGEPAPVQWRDNADRIEEGDALELSGVGFGEAVSIVWLDDEEGDAYEMDTHTVLPTVEFAGEYHEESESVTIRHSEGETIVGEIEILVEDERGRTRTTDWPALVVAPGDSVLVTDVPMGSNVEVSLLGHTLAYIRTRQYGEDHVIVEP